MSFLAVQAYEVVQDEDCIDTCSHWDLLFPCLGRSCPLDAACATSAGCWKWETTMMQFNLASPHALSSLVHAHDA